VLFLSGAITHTLLADVRTDVGIMFQPGMGNDSKPFRFRTWAADNGRFARPDEWLAGDWLEWLAGLRRDRERCLFAVAPDVVGDARATLELSLPYLATIRQLGYAAAFVSQDGCTSDLVPWDLIDCLFVGGTNAWKLCEASYALVAEANALGKWTHMGRVNSLQRLRACAVSGFDSADGTYLKYGPDVNWGRLCDWLDDVNGPRPLEVVA
jgi:hypothetical protein